MIGGGSNYCIVFQAPTSGVLSGTNKVAVGIDSSSPSHDGNYVYFAENEWNNVSTSL